MLLSNVEYVALRLARRFLFPTVPRRLARLLPYYRANVSETQPDETCAMYAQWLGVAGRNLEQCGVVEVGSGATNGAGYALACAGVRRVWCVEPFVEFDRKTDARLLRRLAREHGRNPSDLMSVVRRCVSLDEVGAGVGDVVVSHSVLEHVSNLASLCDAMYRVLAKDGSMLHVVDYRDHFFKYPLHFLQFSSRTWAAFLDPGDLPRTRLSEHLAELERSGFATRVLYKEDDLREFERVKSRISPDFDLTDQTLGVVKAVLYCERAESMRAGSDVFRQSIEDRNAAR